MKYYYILLMENKCNLNSITNKNEFNPNNIHYFCDISTNSYSDWCVDNTFIVFKSFNNILYLIYSTDDDSIISYDLEKKQIINEIKNSHKETINNFRHYFDKKNKRDLILSISMKKNNIRVWNVNNIKCLANILNINNNGFLCSASFLKNKEEIYIITSHISFDTGISEPIKIFNFNGQKINTIKNSKEPTYFIDIYYENKNNQQEIYIISGNKGFIKSYNYKNNEIYYKYQDNNENNNVNFNINTYESIVINDNEKIIKLIGSNREGKILVWNFHSGLILNKIIIEYRCFNGISLWENDYLFAGCDDDSIKLIDLKSNKIVKSFEGHNKSVSTVKTTMHSQYGKCLLSQGDEDDQIKLWII